MGGLRGKVALITGAARGQGRAHAVQLASDGADVIAIDICANIDTIPYDLGTREDLDETCRLVEKQGQRASAHVADVREIDQLERAFTTGLVELDTDHADIVIANAGVCSWSPGVDDNAAFHDALAVMLVGVWNTIRVTTPAMIAAGRGGSVVLTSSTAALRGYLGGTGGLDGYTAAKAAIVGLMHVYANILGPHNIRVNTIHPTGVDTAMLHNPAYQAWADAALANPLSNLANKLPDVPLVQAADIANAVAWLVSEAGRYVSGVTLPVDAGFCNA